MSEQSQLIKPREVVRQELTQRLKIGEDLLKKTVMNFKDLKDLENEMWEWHSYNTELAKRVFSPNDNEYYQEIRNPTPSAETLLGAISTDRSIGAQLNNTRNEIVDRNKVIRQLIGKLDLIPVSKSAELSQSEKLHLILSYLVERFEKYNQECFSSEEIAVGIGSIMHLKEVEYLCKILIDDNFVRDTRSQDGFNICAKDSTSHAFYGKHYLNQSQSMEKPIKMEENVKFNQKSNNDQVFIVHGHNSSVKVEAARTIEKLGLKAIILHEQANAGLTVIEKFEKHSKVDYAIVLLTDDDIGRAKSSNDELPRARQNVVLEMGYFIGVLGRERVCILYTPGVELPSDVSGILYTRLDEEGNWKTKLAKELIHAGFNVDVTKVI